MSFKVFKEEIGVEGYKRLVHNIMFPGPSRKPLNDFIDVALYNDFRRVPNFNFKISAFKAASKIFPKRTVFSRVRVIQHSEIGRFINGAVDLNDFYPPNPEFVLLKDGRYNDSNSRVMYLSDSPETAEIECKIKDGDCFLRSQFSLKREMAFFSLSEESALTKPFMELINNEDARFYPVITYLMSSIMKFEGFHGCTYDSVPAVNMKNFKHSKMNLVVWGSFIEDIDFEYSFLSKRVNGQLCSSSLYYIVDRSLVRVNYSQDPDEYNRISKGFYKKLSKKTQSIRKISKKLLRDTARPFRVVSGL